MSASVRLPKMRVTFVLSVGFLKMARASWYILFLERVILVLERLKDVESRGAREGRTYGVIPVPPAIKAM